MTATIAVSELPESRVGARKIHGQENELELKLLVEWADSGGGAFPGFAWMEAQTGYPRVRSRLPSSVHGGDAWLRSFVIREVRQESEDGVGKQVLRVRASSRWAQYGGQWVRVGRTAGFRSISAWRVAATLPTDGDEAFPPTADIGGTSVDINGAPRVHEIPQVQIVLDHLWDRTLPPVSGAPNEPPVADWVKNYGNTRNSNAMFGCPVGTLLYRGCAANPEDECYSLSHHWIYDPWFHLEQFAVSSVAGPILGATATAIGIGIRQATKVGWLQKYAQADHRAIFSGGLWGLIEEEINNPKPTY